MRGNILYNKLMSKHAKQAIFEKFYTRTLSLLVAQFWYVGEHDILPEILEGEVCFNPLFAFKVPGRADAYYETNNPFSEEERITRHFTKSPDKFDKILESYIEVCHKSLELPKGEGAFKEYFLTCAKFSALLAIILEIAELKSEDAIGRRLGLKAGKVREKTHTVGEKVCHNLIKVFEETAPDLKKYKEVITLDEVLRGRVDRDIEKRNGEFILFENQIFFDINVLEKEKNIKIVRNK